MVRVVCLILVMLHATAAVELSVVCKDRACAKTNSIKNATAIGNFLDTVESKGWAEISVRTSGVGSDLDQAYGAGFVEGALTSSRIHQHWLNFHSATFLSSSDNATLYETAVAFVSSNDQFVVDQIKKKGNNSPYWQQTALVWEQMRGLHDGYNSITLSSQKLTWVDFLLMNAVVDLSSIIHHPFLSTDSQAREFTRSTTHCSAIVKVTPDLSELWTSHNTWTGYFMMLRAVKTYDLPFMTSKTELVPAPRVIFSGFFGTLASTDDFFVLSSGLVVQETTNAVYNESLLATITPASVLTWTRSIVANRLATSGESWVKIFSEYNSGTINNQWMVVDYNRFKPRTPLVAGTLWILEQLPGYIKTADVTRELSLGYWPSYNRPYFEEVRKLSGADEMTAKFGNYYSYSLYARAKIFRRDQGSVSTRDDLKRLMRYNEWQHDPFSIDEPWGNRSAELAIAARDDLDTEGARPFGNIDAKMVSSADVKAMRFEAISGPTHQGQVPFSWTGRWAHNDFHHGHPTRFAFPWFNFSAPPGPKL